MLGRTIIIVALCSVALAAFGPMLGEAVQSAADHRQAQANPTEPAPAEPAAPAAAAPQATMAGAIVLSRSDDSHFRADMTVNGRPVRMLVDSGASIVVLRESDARAAGIQVDASAFTGSAMTAGGQVAVAPVMIERLAIGSIERRNVPAAIMQGDALPESLLGQSFLNQLAEVRTVDGTMQIR